VIPGLFLPDAEETLGHVVAHSEEFQAPSFLLGLTQSLQGSISPAKMKGHFLEIQAQAFQSAAAPLATTFLHNKIRTLINNLGTSRKLMKSKGL
jgi:hypothetical protein